MVQEYGRYFNTTCMRFARLRLPHHGPNHSGVEVAWFLKLPDQVQSDWY